MQDMRLLALGSSDIFKREEEEDGKQSREGMAAGKYLWMVWHLHCWNFSDTLFCEMLNTELVRWVEKKYEAVTKNLISILLQIALVRSQQEV